jgi:outer membrane lipoprotein-sorting protein
MNIKDILKTIIFISVLAFSVLAQDKGKDFLDAVQKKYMSINNFSADLKNTYDKTIVVGKVYYAKGNKFKLEFKNSNVFSDGKTIWNYNKSQKKVVIDNVSNSEPSYFSITQFLYDYPSKSSISLDKEDNHNILVLIPLKDSNLNFKKAKIWVKEDSLIERVLVENVSGGSVTLQFSNYKLNQNLPGTMFIFSLPEGTNVIDLRK